MRFIYLLAVSAFLLSATAASAQGDEAKDLKLDYIFAKKQKDKCDDGSGNLEPLVQCMQREYSKIDDELNRLYKKLVSVLEKPNGITASERSWIRYRDAECSDAVMQMGGEGKFYLLARSLIVLDRVHRGTNEINKMASSSRLQWLSPKKGMILPNKATRAVSLSLAAQRPPR